MADEREYRELQGPGGSLSHVVGKKKPSNMCLPFLDLVFLPHGISKTTKVQASNSPKKFQEHWHCGQLICFLCLNKVNTITDVKIKI